MNRLERQDHVKTYVAGKLSRLYIDMICLLLPVWTIIINKTLRSLSTDSISRVKSAEQQLLTSQNI